MLQQENKRKCVDKLDEQPTEMATSIWIQWMMVMTYELIACYRGFSVCLLEIYCVNPSFAGVGHPLNIFICKLWFINLESWVEMANFNQMSPEQSYYGWSMWKIFPAINKSYDKWEKECTFWVITERVSMAASGSLHNSLYPPKSARNDICIVTPIHNSSLVVPMYSQVLFFVFVFAWNTADINGLCRR